MLQYAQPPKLYTVKEVVGILKVSRTTLWKLLRSGQLECLRIRRRVLFTVGQLEAFITQESERSNRRQRRRRSIR